MNDSPSEQPTDVKPLPPAPTLPFSMKAHLQEYRRRLGLWRYILAFLISLFILYRFGPIAWVAAIIAIVALIFIILYFFANRHVTATPEGLEYRNGFYKKRTVTYADIHDVKVFPSYIEPGFGLVPRVIVTLPNEPFVSLTGLYWKYDDIDLLLATLQDKKLRIESYEGFVVSKTIGDQFPNALAGFEKHPYWFATLLTIGIVIAIAFGVYLFGNY